MEDPGTEPDEVRAFVQLAAARWSIGPAIGSGGFGRVVESRSSYGADGVLKFVRKAPGAEREMLFVGLDEHVRNIVPVIDTGETAESWIMAMPRAEESLQDRIERDSPFSHAEVVRVLGDVAVALADLDGRVVHRDVKPANILLLGGTWCLADFGIARYIEAATASATWNEAGSRLYVAPERWQGGAATPASDIYSFGIVAYELLMGSPPFDGPEVGRRHLEERPAAIPPDVSPLGRLVGKCLEKSPADRPTAAEVLVGLDAPQPRDLTSGAAAKLFAANELADEEQTALIDAEARAQREWNRRAVLFESARDDLGHVSSELQDFVLERAPRAELRRPPQSDRAWEIHLRDAALSLSAVMASGEGAWGVEAGPFDVAAFATIMVTRSPDPYGYVGRSHALWYCDAETEGRYRWYETAFRPSVASSVNRASEPFALVPSAEAAGALTETLTPFMRAWPFTRLDTGIFDFEERWANWFAEAALGELSRPSMPERPIGGFRRRP